MLKDKKLIVFVVSLAAIFLAIYIQSLTPAILEVIYIPLDAYACYKVNRFYWEQKTKC